MPRSPLVRLRRWALDRIHQKLRDNPPPLRLVFWDGETFDFVAPPCVTITIRSRAMLRMLLVGNFAKLGDAYVAGELTADGRIQDILRIGIDLAERLGKWPIATRLMRLAAFVPRPHSRHKDAADISYHYDVSNEFYRLWLDDNMIYSCAYFRTGNEDINAAQEQKLDHICRKLQLAPDEVLLDVGCGWGGLLQFAARHYAVRGVGVTLSERQYRYARDWMAKAGLAETVEIKLQDYRDLRDQACFDKIVSVGMYEHVGLKNLPRYFDEMARLLKPGGALLNHGIVVTDPRGRPQGPPGGEFIGRYVFPGGELANLGRVVHEVARCGLELADVEDLRPHYAQTLIRWVERLEARRDEAIAAAGAELTASGACISPAWRTRSIVAGSRWRRFSPISRPFTAWRRARGRANTNIQEIYTRRWHAGWTGGEGFSLTPIMVRILQLYQWLGVGHRAVSEQIATTFAVGLVS